MSNNTVTIYSATANAKVFIVPNEAFIMNMDLIGNQRRAENLRRMAEINGFQFDNTTDKIVQLWWHSQEELGSENLSDHGFNIDIAEHGKIHVSPGQAELGYLPLRWFKYLKEGESMDIIIPVHAKCDGENIDFNIKFTITADQLGARYRRFGKFEEVLERVSA